MRSSSPSVVRTLIVGPLAGSMDGLSCSRSAPGEQVPWPATCPDPGLVIAVDGGFDRCVERGWRVDILVGDFDSVSAAGLALAEFRGIETVRLPIDKDQSDLDVALTVADERGATAVTVVGMMGGRLDHQLAVLGAVAAPRRSAVVMLGPSVDGGQGVGYDIAYVLRTGGASAVEPDRTFSVITLTGPAVVSVSGARWPLSHHPIAPLSSLGLSNEALATGATVECVSGVVLVVVPPAIL